MSLNSNLSAIFLVPSISWTWIADLNFVFSLGPFLQRVSALYSDVAISLSLKIFRLPFLWWSLRWLLTQMSRRTFDHHCWWHAHVILVVEIRDAQIDSSLIWRGGVVVIYLTSIGILKCAGLTFLRHISHVQLNVWVFGNLKGRVTRWTFSKIAKKCRK